SGASLVAANRLRSEAQGTASLDQTRSRGAIRARQADAIELGNEPPLSVDGGSSGFVDRRRVSVQCLAGTILTALSGAALMGGAVFTSLDGEANFASLPERVEVALRGALGGGAHRGDNKSNMRRAARRARRWRRKRHTQERSAADGGRADVRASGHPRFHHQPRR